MTAKEKRSQDIEKLKEKLGLNKITDNTPRFKRQDIIPTRRYWLFGDAFPRYGGWIIKHNLVDKVSSDVDDIDEIINNNQEEKEYDN